MTDEMTDEMTDDAVVTTYARTGLDPVSRDRLAAAGLDYRRVAATSDDYPGWLGAVTRGFQGAEPSDAEVATGRLRGAEKRLVGVFDPASADPGTPVATVASWGGRLSVPGGEVPAWAISAVTVSQTHRRRGLARAMLEGELRAASSAGAPIAMLTVSESTLYGRYGFGSAATAATVEIDTRRVRWIGPDAGGRLDFVPRERARDLILALHDTARRAAPGDVSLPPGHDDRFTGTAADAKDGAEVRCVQYADAQGVARGILTYTVSSHPDDNTKATARVRALIATTDDAYAALWRFLLDLDLVAHVRAELCAVDEPVLYMIDDRRAARVSVVDHHYLRVLDVVAALEARRYGARGDFVIEVADPLGISSGRYRLHVDGAGVGTAAPADAAGDAGTDAAPHHPGAVRVALGSSDLAAIYLGGVPPLALVRAGRIRSSDPEALARAFSWPVAPRLSIWY